MNALGGEIWAIGPTVCVGLIFWFVMRAVIRADRNERAAFAKIEAQEAARRPDSRSTDLPNERS